jgi:hypothetical protein
MALIIKDSDVEQLAEDLGRLTNTSKTEVIRHALREKKERLTLAGLDARRQRLLGFLENRAWPQLPAEASRAWTKEEEECALGYGEHGEPA